MIQSKADYKHYIACDLKAYEMNANAKVGAWCRLHPSTCIGDYDGVPKLGNYVYIGPGAKLYGDITIGDNVAIGANAVVNQSFGSNLTIGGIPARVLTDKGALNTVFPSSVIECANLSNCQ